MFEGFQIGFNDLAQIAILYIVIYGLIRVFKGTRSAQMLLGFFLLVVALIALVSLFHFDVLARIVYFLLIYLSLSLVVVFQQELRRLLALVGARGLFGGRNSFERDDAMEDRLIEAMIYLAKKKIGTLIAIERGISLANYDESGIKLRALVSTELLASILTPPVPLHDGGIIIRNGRIAAAHCVFPVSHRRELIESGMRHRAAVGLSEETDALVLVVSEERGDISVAHNGRIRRYSRNKAERILRLHFERMRGSKNRGQWLVFMRVSDFFGRLASRFNRNVPATAEEVAHDV